MANNRNTFLYGSRLDKLRRNMENINSAKKVEQNRSTASKEEVKKTFELMFNPKEFVKDNSIKLINKKTWTYNNVIGNPKEIIDIFNGIDKDTKNNVDDRMINFFKVIANKNQDANKFLKITIDNLKNITLSKQETAANESISTFNRAISYFNNNVKNKGKLFAWDLETIGGKDLNGIWRPEGITEFSLQSYNYATKSIDKTDVLLGMDPNTINKLKKEIARAIEDNTIDSNERLKVTAMRMAKYGDDAFRKEYDPTKGYYVVKSFPTQDKNNWKDIDVIEKGFKQFEEVWNDPRIKAQEAIDGIRPDQKAIVTAIQETKESLNNNTGFLLGQNHLSHDMPIMNAELLKWSKSNSKIAEILKNDITFNISDEKTLDLLGATQMYSNHYGISAMYGYVDISDVEKPRGQEFIVQKVLSKWFKANGLQPHKASDDVTALLGLATVNSEVSTMNNKPFLDYITEGLTKLENKETNIIPGKHILRAKSPIIGDWSGKNFFNYAQNKSTGEIFLAGNYVINANGIMQDEKKTFSAGFGINKGRLYNVLDISRYDFNEETRETLGRIAPNFSGDHFYKVQLALDVPEECEGFRINELTQNLIFASKKEMEAFMSGEFDIVATKDKNGKVTIEDDMVRYFDIRRLRADKKKKAKIEMLDPNLRVTPKNRKIRRSKNDWIRNDQVLYERERKAEAERLLVSRANNAIFGDKSYQRAKQIIDIEDQLIEKKIIKDPNSINSRVMIDIMSDRVSKGKAPLNLTNAQIMTAKNIINKTLQYNNSNNKVLESTINNIAIGMDMLRPQENLVRAVISNLEETKGWKDKSSGYRQELYSRVIKRYKEGIAEQLYDSFEKQDRAILGNKKLETTYAELSNMFEINLKPLMDKSKKKITYIDPSHSEELSDIIKLDLSNKNIHYNLLNKVTAAIYGDEVKQDKAHQLDAMVQLENMLSKTTVFRKNNIKFRTGFNRDETGNIIGVHPYELAEDIVKKMRLLKEKNVTNGIINFKHAFMKSINGNLEFNNILNDQKIIDTLLPKVIEDVSKDFRYVEINTKDANTEYNMLRALSDKIVSKYYMPSLKEFKTSSGYNPTTRKLYDLAKKDIIDYMTSILQSASKIDGTSLYIEQTNGDIFGIRGDRIINFGQYIPKVTLHGGVLDARTGNMKNQLTNVLTFQKDKQSIKGGAVSSINVANHKRLIKSTRNRVIKDGYDEAFNYLESTLRHNRRSLIEKPTINGYGGNDIDANNSVVLSNISNVILDLFSEDSDLKALVEKEFPDRNLVKTLREDLKYYVQGNDLDAETNRDIIKNMHAILEIIKSGGNVSEDFDFLTTGLIFGGQEKKVREDLVATRGYRPSNSTFSTFDNVQRPPITQSGNAYKLRTENLTPEQIGNVITSKSMEMRTMNELKAIGKVTTDTMMNVTYIDTNSLNILIDSNFNEILNNNTIENNTKKQLIKSYNFVRSNINTFEQERAIDARVHEQRYGLKSNQIQKLSSSNEFLSVLDDMKTEEYIKQRDTILDYTGKFIETDKGLMYQPSHGKLVKRGESILKWKGFADTNNDFVSKMNNGVFNFNFYDEYDNRLKPKDINKIISENIELFYDTDENGKLISKSNAERFGILNSLLEKDYNVKGQFAIEDVSAKGYIKTMTSGAEKGMTKVLYTPYGTNNDKIKTFFEETNTWNMVKSSGGVITDEALEAIYYSDKNKADAILNRLNFKSLTEFKQALAKERYSASEFLFGDIFKGKIDLLANDNITGHENLGSLYQGSLGKAINSLTKQYKLEGRKNAQSEAIDYIVDLMNNHQEYQFITNMDLNAHKKSAIKVFNKDGRLVINDDFVSSVNKVSALDNTRFTNLLNKIDTQLTKLDEDDRLIAHDIYILNKNGYYDLVKDFSGSVTTTKRDIQVRNEATGIISTIKDAKVIAGSNTYEPVKYVRDSEVQSGVNDEYFSLKQKSRSIKKKAESVKDYIRQLKEDQRIARSEAVAKGLPASSVKKNPEIDRQYQLLDSLKREKEQVDDAIAAYSGAIKTMKMGDTELAILEKVSLSEAGIDKINDLITSGEIDTDFFLDSVAFSSGTTIDANNKLVFHDNLINKRFFKSISDDIKVKQFYREEYEDELTEDMLKAKKHLTSIYKEVHDRYKTKIGVDTAETLYKNKTADMGNRFNLGEKIIENTDGLASDREYLTKEAGYINKNILDVNFDLEHISDKNMMIDLGDEFGDKRYIAVPGLGSILKDQDVRTKAQSELYGLQRIIQNMYDIQGNTFEDAQDEYLRYKALADQKREDVVNSINKQIFGKHGVLQQSSQVEMETASYRLKASGIVSNGLDTDFIQKAKNLGYDLTANAEFTEKAMINGKSIADWERKGIFYDYKFMSRQQFENMGYFKDDTLIQYGFLKKGINITQQDRDTAIEKMEEFIKTHGTYDITDRYPNIKNDSLAVTRVFYGEGLASNQTKVSMSLMLGANGDHDGDLYSSFLIKYKNPTNAYIDGGMYEKRKVELLNSGHTKEETFSILKQEGYENFIDLDQGVMLQASSFKGRNWKEEALKKLEKDRLRVQNMYNPENRVAVPGGKSILGKIAINNLETAPSIDEFNKIEADANNILQTAKDMLIKMGADDGRFDENIRSGISPTRLDDALTVIKKAMNDNTIDTSNITDDIFRSFEATAIKRVNIDRYATEAMAKTGLPTTGSINLALAAVRLADFQASTNANDLAFSNYVWSILGEPEQLAISSKKVDGSSIYDDRRVKDLLASISDIFHNPDNKNGMKIDKKLVNGLVDWLDKYGDDIFETSYKKFGDYILDKNIITELNNITDEAKRLAEGTKYIKEYFIDHITNMTGDQMALSYLSSVESVGRNGHNASRLWYNGSVGLAAAEGNSMTSRIAGVMGYADDAKYNIYRERRAQEELNNIRKKAEESVRATMGSTKKASAKVAENIVEGSIKAAEKTSGSGLGKLGMLAIGTGIGLMIGGYASGNPLNDKSADQVNQENQQNNQQQPTQVMSIPEFMDKDSGYVTGNTQQGYIINLKADTRKGRKYMEKIMAKAAETSVGGAVSVNMNIRNISSKGITDKDIEKYINQHL